jgi:peptide/nickel transport system substrate-binding protein
VPSNIFFPRSSQRAYSAALTGWQSSAYEPNNIFAPVLLTEDRTRGWGTVNRHGYSNPVVDRLYERAVVAMDQQDRVRLWREAMRIAMEDAPVLPVHHQVNIWATRRGLVYAPRSDEYTLVSSLTVVP